MQYPKSKLAILALAFAMASSTQAAPVQRHETAQSLSFNDLSASCERQAAVTAGGNPDADRSAVQELAKKKKKKKKASSKASY
jgi:hypothetical protein